MKFPLLVNAFGHQKLILEMGGNAVGVFEPLFQPQQHRRRRVEHGSQAYQTRFGVRGESIQESRRI